MERCRPVSILAALSLVMALLPVVPAGAFSDPDSPVFINEIHYDNEGTDSGEAIEVAGPAGTDLTGWTIVLYNGSGGAVYDTRTLSGVIPDEGSGYGAVHAEYPSNGIQNGSPDGVALVDAGGAVVQFLSYEGTFTAVGGAADGLTSTDIGVGQTAAPVGESLQLTGEGTVYDDFAWTDGPSSFGCLNPGQTDIAGACGDDPDPDPDPDPTDTPVFVNEFHYDNAGADTGEAIEVAGPAGTDLTGWSVVLYNGNGGGPYGTVSLEGAIDDEGSGYGAVHIETPGLQNGSPDGLALVDDAGAVIQFLSYEGSFTAVGGPAHGMDSDDIGVSQPGNSPVGISLQLAGNGTIYEDFTWTDGPATFGCLNPGQEDIFELGCIDQVLISEVQGDGETTPLNGQMVRVEGLVVADFEGPQPNLRGFYVQEEEEDWDDDPATSEGIFVFNGTANDVELGDGVSVTGVATEFQGQTQLSSVIDVQVVEPEVGLPPAAEVNLPFPDADHLERYEGMLVEFPQDLYVTEFFQLGRFGQVVVSSGDRLRQPTAVADPGDAARAVQAANDLNRLIVDDTTNDQNPDPIVFGRGGAPLTAQNTLRGGDTLSGAVGVMTYTWAGNSASGNAYRLRPQSPDHVFEFQPQNQRPDSPPEVGGSLQVASFNVLNYFLTLDQGGNQCGVVPDDCRGANTEFELQRQRDKLLVALEQLDADVLGLMELENTPGVNPEADLAAGLNDALGDGTYAAVEAGPVGDDVIRVGMLYKPASVTPVGSPQVVDYGDGRNRASLVQTFAENDTGEVFSVVVNHFKSKGCGEGSGANADQGDGQGCWNQVRVEAAGQLVGAMSEMGYGDDDWLVIGDLNSYDHEDPIRVFEEAGFVDLTRQYGGEEAYGYVFDGQWGYLDYALASGSLVDQVSGTAEYHINADEPSVLDYNTDFKSDAQIEYLYAPNEFRTSDHDPVVVGLELEGGTGAVGDLTADPDLLWPPNHDYRTVDLTAEGGDVTVAEVTSSEADSGLGEDDLPDDVVVEDADTVLLRAERYARDGRTYLVAAAVHRDGQARYDTVAVLVPHDVREEAARLN